MILNNIHTGIGLTFYLFIKKPKIKTNKLKIMRWNEKNKYK